ncbi:unnamed protein product [Vitrella brassicaformis CCMP3155]|uniref:enoyl-[acyl-carrier-protein] reductase n=2 Tax=Vitrella brassicaformis TaxID=1169539 RepID=A0A0G4FQ05_VITBC|nr:unnamed protein product [Vitrella brassicaformis CCMP3155]|mmetsp:Transcript_18050/g.43458  ORF Transcript_18050/g.43458 Transcript_18050/m.43458 type:complete len:826 (+) Transcript_18050:175-2652(+)|eukprot:CEM15887.1 unnamed protein product [Vitrella brassicaformis CCMP3155]
MSGQGDLDLYAVLGVDKTAPLAEIRKAFRQKAVKEHPDKGGDPTVFQNINKAYEVLSDGKLRAHYDKTGRAVRSAEEEFMESFSKGKGGKAGGGDKASDANVIDVAERLVRPKGDQTHEEGFQEWLRSRNQKDSLITDDIILDRLGTCKTSYETVPHRCRHATQKVVRRKDIKISKRSDVMDDPSRLCETITVKLRPELEWGEVLVNIRYAAVNPYDITLMAAGEDVLRSWHQDSTTSALPLGHTSAAYNYGTIAGDRTILGSEGVAVVEKVGPGVKDLREGDWVVPLKDTLGTWQVAAVWRERDLLKIPQELIPIEYAALAKELYLAYRLVDLCSESLQPGDGVVVNGANGLVGQLVIQLAKLIGFRPIAVIRRHSESSFETLVEHLHELGANRVFAEDDPIRHRLLAEGAALPKMALDCVLGSTSTAKLTQALDVGGRVVVYGGMSGQPFQLPWHMLVSSEIKVESFYLNRWLESGRNQTKMVENLESFAKLIDNKKLAIQTREFPLTDITSAMKFLTEKGRIAKPLLAVPTIQEEEAGLQAKAAEEKNKAIKSKELEESLFAQNIPETQIKKTLEGLHIVECESAGDEKATLVWLHDFGQIPDEYLSLFKRSFSKDEVLEHVKVVIPSAPKTVGTDEDPSWWCGDFLFDTTAAKSNSGGSGGSLDEKLKLEELQALGEIEESCALVAQLIKRELRENRQEPEKLMLGGVGQGALIALFTALTQLDVAIGGVCCFGMQVLPGKVLDILAEKATSPSAKFSKLFLLHGSNDTVAPPGCGEKLKKMLGQRGINATFDVVPNGKHEVSAEELGHLTAVMTLSLKLY